MTPASARAGFNPIGPSDPDCAGCCPLPPATREIAWHYYSNELPYYPNCGLACDDFPGHACPRYTNHLDHTRWATANAYVKQFGFYVNSFETEYCCDKLKYGEDGQPLQELKGTVSPQWLSIGVSGSLQATPAVFVFHTDYSWGYPGFYLGSARVQCQSSPATDPAYLRPFYRHTGVLLGWEDTVYFQTPGTSAAAAKHVTFQLWSPVPNANFDLYARCNALPTDSQYDFASTSSDSMEYIHTPAQQCIYGTWYLAVFQAGSIAGQFNLVRTDHWHHEHHTLRAGTNFNASAGQLDTMKIGLENGMRDFFAATEGTVLIEHVDLWNSNDCSNCNGAQCDVCFEQVEDCDGSCCPCCGHASGLCASSPVYIHQACWANGETLSHEWGHKYFCADDEYYNVSDPKYQCGHSIMAKSNGDQNNMCWFHNDDFQDHKMDKGCGAADTGLPSAWDQANNADVTPWKPSETPDNYDYWSFDFDNHAGTVTIH
ncbi:MAG: hypothetical protein HY744_26760 [Deltaproteobacteria bacterium]|nr:hypothetical protein [Deltaproteobacteria bacterium]